MADYPDNFMDLDTSSDEEQKPSISERLRPFKTTAAQLRRITSSVSPEKSSDEPSSPASPSAPEAHFERALELLEGRDEESLVKDKPRYPKGLGIDITTLESMLPTMVESGVSAGETELIEAGLTPSSSQQTPPPLPPSPTSPPPGYRGSPAISVPRDMNHGDRFVVRKTPSFHQQVNEASQRAQPDHSEHPAYRGHGDTLFPTPIYNDKFFTEWQKRDKALGRPDYTAKPSPTYAEKFSTRWRARGQARAHEGVVMREKSRATSTEHTDEDVQAEDLGEVEDSIHDNQDSTTPKALDSNTLEGLEAPTSAKTGSNPPYELDGGTVPELYLERPRPTELAAQDEQSKQTKSKPSFLSKFRASSSSSSGTAKIASTPAISKRFSDFASSLKGGQAAKKGHSGRLSPLKESPDESSVSQSGRIVAKSSLRQQHDPQSSAAPFLVKAKEKLPFFKRRLQDSPSPPDDLPLTEGAITDDSNARSLSETPDTKTISHDTTPSADMNTRPQAEVIDAKTIGAVAAQEVYVPESGTKRRPDDSSSCYSYDDNAEKVNMTNLNNAVDDAMAPWADIPASPTGTNSGQLRKASGNYDLQKFRGTIGLDQLEERGENDMKHPQHPYAWDTTKVMCLNKHSHPAARTKFGTFAGKTKRVSCTHCGEACCQYQHLLTLSTFLTGDRQSDEQTKAKANVQLLRDEYPSGLEDFDTLMTCFNCERDFCPKCGTLCTYLMCRQTICKDCISDRGVCNAHA